MVDTQWFHIGEVDIAHNTQYPFHPEDEGRAPCWRRGSGPSVWAQALVVVPKYKSWAISLGNYLVSLGYDVQCVNRQSRVLLVYRHPALELKVTQVLSEPRELK